MISWLVPALEAIACYDVAIRLSNHFQCCRLCCWVSLRAAVWWIRPDGDRRFSLSDNPCGRNQVILGLRTQFPLPAPWSQGSETWSESVCFDFTFCNPFCVVVSYCVRRVCDLNRLARSMSMVFERDVGVVHLIFMVE